jgi:hypothetical protein
MRLVTGTVNVADFEWVYDFPTREAQDQAISALRSCEHPAHRFQVWGDYNRLFFSKTGKTCLENAGMLPVDTTTTEETDV